MDSSGGFDLALGYIPNRKFMVDFTPEINNRIPHADKLVEASIETVWQTLQNANPSLFNGSKFRLSHISCTPSSSCARLHLGLTDYKTFQGTHVGAQPLIKFGRKHMARVLGNVVILETIDGKTVLLRRNGMVGEGRGMLAFPGGHPEPDCVKGAWGNWESEEIINELWEGARREVLEELFLEDGDVVMGNMVCLGIVERERDGKPSMVFYVKVGLSGKEVEEKWKGGNGEMEESVDVLIFPIEELRGIAEGREVENGKGVGCVSELVGGAALWVQMRDHDRR